MSVEDNLYKHLAKFEESPIVFVGSGLSRRYCGLESWEGLLRKFSEIIDKPYEYYKSTCGGDFPKIASLLAKDFHEAWWKSEQFSKSREEYREQCINESSALKIEICNYMRNITWDNLINEEYRSEIDALRGVVADGIITTNWDNLLELLFHDYAKYIGQEDILFGKLHHVGEIYKIHGCCTSPNSLVLTSADYEKFNQRYPYLAAKLLAMFVEHPVIFLGYSMSDENIGSIVESIGACLRSDQISKLRDRLIFVSRPEEGEENISDSMIRIGDTGVPTKLVKANSYLPIFTAMSRINRKFPASMLRKLKEHVYDLVLNNDPKGRLYVQDIDGHSEEEFDVVFGVGAIAKLHEKGHIGINRHDILKDILFDDGGFKDNIVLEKVIPREAANAFIPVFKYLKRSGRILDGGRINLDGLPQKVISRTRCNQSTFQQPGKYANAVARFPSIDIGIKELYESCSFRDFLNHASRVREDLIVTEDLRDILKGRFNECIERCASTPSERTYFAKLVCLLDWLENRR